MLEILQTYGVFYLIGQYPNGPLGGLVLTLSLAALALVLALPVGLLLALCRISPFGILRWPATVLVYVVRGTPLLMVIFWAYFLLPSLTGHKTDQFNTMLAALVIFDGAYLAEIIRSGIQSLPRGQMESARSLGFSYLQAMGLVILPQALRNMVPALLSQFVTTIKDTSYLWGAMALQELMGRGMILMNSYNSTAQIFAIFGIMALIYFIVCFTLSQIVRAYQRRLKEARAA